MAVTNKISSSRTENLTLRKLRNAMVSAFEMFPTGCSGCTLYYCTVVVLFQIELTLSSLIAFLMPTFLLLAPY